MHIEVRDEYDVARPKIELELRDLSVGEQWYLTIGPVTAEMTVDVLRHLQTEVNAALMELEHAEDGHRDMLNGEREASEDYDDAPF